jgi:endo-1,3(4)-beta-glucanase
MAKLTSFLLALVHLSPVHSVPAGEQMKRASAIVAAREITLTDVLVTTSYSTAITSLQSASPTVEPTNSGVRCNIAQICVTPLKTKKLKTTRAS